MALSDNCASALNELVDGVVQYAGTGYTPKQLNKVVKALFEIASIVIEYDASPKTPSVIKDEMVNNLVVNSLLSKLTDERVNAVLNALAKVAKLNAKLAYAFDEVSESFNDADVATLTPMYSKIYKHIGAIQYKRGFRQAQQPCVSYHR